MIMHKFIIAVIGLTLLAGCANEMAPEQRADLNRQRIESAARPMLTLECAQGCQFDKLELRDPRALSYLPAISEPTNGWDFMSTLVNAAVNVTPFVGMTILGTEAIDALADRQNITNTTTSTINERGDVAGGDIVGGNVRGDVAGDTRGDTRRDTRGDTRRDTRGDVSGDTTGDVNQPQDE